MIKRLHTPISYEDIADLRIGDVVYLSGTISTCRDAGHGRVVRDGIFPQTVDLKDGAIFHAGPIVQEKEGEYRMISVGPTTSRRMESLEADFIRKTGVRLIVGKGGMMDRTAEACRSMGAIHCAFPGGCAIVAADSVNRIEGVEWLDFGMPEALWILSVNDFGPLIVSIDVCGNNLFENNKALFSRRLAEFKKRDE